MTDLAVEMCICCMNIRTNLILSATTLTVVGQGPATFRELEAGALSHSEYGFISLHCNRHVFLIYPLITSP